MVRYLLSNNLARRMVTTRVIRPELAIRPELLYRVLRANYVILLGRRY